MKFLGTLAFGFSTIAAMIAALLSLGFQVKVESPLSPQSVAKEQQLSQCSAALSQAEQQVAEAQSKIQSLDFRLRDAGLIAEQTATRLSTEIAARMQASQNSGLPVSSSSMITGVGVGLLMFPLGFIFGRRRSSDLPLLARRVPDTLTVVEPPREPLHALPRFEGPRVGAGARSGAMR